jgi:hypothetical protein
MTRSIQIAALLLAGAAALAGAQSKPGLASQLQDGMKIEYSADPGPPSMWLIGTAIPVPNQEPGTNCMRYVVQKGPEPGAADTLRQCVRGDTLFAIDRYGEWVMMRPVGAGMRVDIRRSNGGTLIETGAMAADTIGGIIVPIVVTTYTVRGPNGQAIQQLRERFALSLGTATRGAFYEADPAAEGGWKLQRSFKMDRIHRP